MGGLKGGKGAKKGSIASQSSWLASNPSKRWGEAFFLLYTPFWLTLTIGIVVPYKLYERFTELGYLLIGLVSAVPAFLIPIFVVGELSRAFPLLHSLHGTLSNADSKRATEWQQPVKWLFE